MDFFKTLIPYDIQQQYITDNRRAAFHSFVDWGNELVIVLNGTANYRVDNHVFTLSRGDILLLTGDYVKEITDAKKLGVCTIFYHEEHLIRTPALFRHLVGYQKFFVENTVIRKNQAESCLHVDETAIHDIELLISHMSHEWHLGKIGSEQMLNSMFYMLITLICRAYSTETRINLESCDAVTQVIAYMHSHYTEDITLEQLAAMAFLSPRHFERRFKEVREMSPMQYVRKLRLAHACLLLEQSELTVAQISMECGFADLNYFVRIFRNAYQMNPSSYRKMKLTAAPSLITENLRP